MLVARKKNYKHGMNWYGKAWMWSKTDKNLAMTLTHLHNNVKCNGVQRQLKNWPDNETQILLQSTASNT